MKIFARIFILGLLSFVNWFFINSLLKTKSNLTTITGTIDIQQPYHESGRGSFDAVIIGVSNSNMEFGIQDNKDRAYKYLVNNNVLQHQAAILYDPNGYNDHNNLSFHIYNVSIDGNEIMTMSEAKEFDKWGLLVFAPFEILAIWFLFFSKFANRKTA